MLSKVELEGWWDHVCLREGWSYKISKWKWVALQILIPALIVSPFIMLMVSKFEDYTLRAALIFMFIFFPITALFSSGRWNKDQKVLPGERGLNDN